MSRDNRDITVDDVKAIDVDALMEKAVLNNIEWLALWTAGKEQWNAWVEQHPNADVNFSRIDFGAFRSIGNNSLIDFGEYKFPNGEVSFFKTIFGNGNVVFFMTTFGDGNVTFSEAVFGDGNVYFNGATFGDGKALFDGAMFGDGNVSFHAARFGVGYVSFSGATFGEGEVDFNKTSFSEGEVEFDRVQFGNGDVNFSGVTFGPGNVNFRGAIFGDGNVHFASAHFGEGDTYFNDARFGMGHIDFVAIRAGSGNFLFSPKPITDTGQLDFRYAAIEGTLVLRGLRSNTTLNLCNTKLGHPLELHDVQIAFRRQLQGIVFEKAVDDGDAASFRRLKKLAKDASDQERALEFFAREMRADYWHGITGLKLFFYYLYDGLSNYGRSIARPLVLLGLSTLCFSSAYAFLARNATSFSDTLLFSASNTLPIYVGSREAKADTLMRLFGDVSSGKVETLPDLVHVLTMTQGFISGVLLFLIALALRNIFRS